MIEPFERTEPANRKRSDPSHHFTRSECKSPRAITPRGHRSVVTAFGNYVTVLIDPVVSNDSNGNNYTQRSNRHNNSTNVRDCISPVRTDVLPCQHLSRKSCTPTRQVVRMTPQEADTYYATGVHPHMQRAFSEAQSTRSHSSRATTWGSHGSYVPLHMQTADLSQAPECRYSKKMFEGNNKNTMTVQQTHRLSRKIIPGRDAFQRDDAMRSGRRHLTPLSMPSHADSNRNSLVLPYTVDSSIGSVSRKRHHTPTVHSGFIYSNLEESDSCERTRSTSRGSTMARRATVVPSIGKHLNDILEPEPPTRVGTRLAYQNRPVDSIHSLAEISNRYEDGFVSRASRDGTSSPRYTSNLLSFESPNTQGNPRKRYKPVTDHIDLSIEYLPSPKRVDAFGHPLRNKARGLFTPRDTNIF